MRMLGGVLLVRLRLLPAEVTPGGAREERFLGGGIGEGWRGMREWR